MLNVESQMLELVLDTLERFHLYFRKFQELREQKLLAIEGGTVFEDVERLFVKYSRVGGVLVNNQQSVGIFAGDIGVCNLEECRRIPGRLGGRGLQRFVPFE